MKHKNAFSTTMGLALLVLVGYGVHKYLLWSVWYSSVEKFRNLEQSSPIDQLVGRSCPTLTPNLKGWYGEVNPIAFGPYRLQLEEKFFQIDAFRFAKDRAGVQIHALAPNMIPQWWPSDQVRELQKNGKLFPVAISLFWSKNGSWVPGSGFDDEKINEARSHTEPSLKSITFSGAGLIGERLYSNGFLYRFTPMDIRSQTGRPQMLTKIVCTNQGTCIVGYQIKDDLWMQYSYGTVNIKCWREIDDKVIKLVQRAIGDTTGFAHSP